MLLEGEFLNIDCIDRRISPGKGIMPLELDCTENPLLWIIEKLILSLLFLSSECVVVRFHTQKPNSTGWEIVSRKLVLRWMKMCSIYSYDFQ